MVSIIGFRADFKPTSLEEAFGDTARMETAKRLDPEVKPRLSARGGTGNTAVEIIRGMTPRLAAGAVSDSRDVCVPVAAEPKEVEAVFHDKKGVEEVQAGGGPSEEKRLSRNWSLSCGIEDDDDDEGRVEGEGGGRPPLVLLEWTEVRSRRAEAAKDTVGTRGDGGIEDVAKNDEVEKERYTSREEQAMAEGARIRREAQEQEELDRRYVRDLICGKDT